MTKYNHGMTIAFEVISKEPHMPTEDEIMEALRMRVKQLENDKNERYDALMGELPFDTYEVDE